MSVISVEIRVNGNLIAALHAVNRGETGRYSKAGHPQCEYDWTSAEFPLHLDGPPAAHAGSVRHYRDAGAIELVRSLCEMCINEDKEAVKRKG
jgi:hypothetical protein